MRTTIATAVVATASLVAVLVPATAASAAAETLKDRTGDVWKVWVGNDPDESLEFKASTRKKNVDVRKSAVNHGGKRVQVKIWYVNLAKDGFRIIQDQLRVRTDGGREFQLYGRAEKTEDGWQSFASVSEITASPDQRWIAPRGVVAECDQDKVRSEVDWKNDTFTLSGPRSCFGDPTWVSGHLDVLAVKSNVAEYAFYDHGHGKGHDMEKGWTAELEQG